jgi:hypothetical protein
MLPQIEVSRGGRHILILPLVGHPRTERTMTTNVTTANLRPMQLGEILDGSFSIYRRHFGLFMKLSVILVWLPTAVTVYFQVRFSGNPFGILSVIEQNLGGTILTGLGFLVVWTICSLLLKAGTIRIISDSYLGHEPQLGSALRFGASKIIPLLLVALSKGLMLVLLYLVAAAGVFLAAFLGRLLGALVAGLFTFSAVVGAIWFVIYVMCGYGVTTPVVVLEDLDSSFEAFGRSWDLSRGAKRKILGTAAVTVLLAQLLPQIIVGAIGGALGASSGAQPIFVVVASLLGVMLAPILPCALTLLYYDLRVRREAFDLQILSEQLGSR